MSRSVAQGFAHAKLLLRQLFCSLQRVSDGNHLGHPDPAFTDFAVAGHPLLGMSVHGHLEPPWPALNLRPVSTALRTDDPFELFHVSASASPNSYPTQATGCGS